MTAGWIRERPSRATMGVGMATVAGVTGVISYTHICWLTLALHGSWIVAHLMPFGVDGLIVIGSAMLLEDMPGQSWLGWLGVVPGAGASLFANVMAGLHWGRFAAGWYGMVAVIFALSSFLFERWLKAQAGRRAAVSGQCLHGGAATLDEAIVSAWLHIRDCLGEPPSQRQLSAAFGQSRHRIAELVGPLEGGRPEEAIPGA